MTEIKIALLGFGTVGSATYRIVQMNRAQIQAKTGVNIEVASVLVRDLNKAYDVPRDLLTTEIDDILNNPDIKIVVELMGGIEPASGYMLAAMAKGKHVVTANKAAVAANYAELMKASEKNQVMLRFEAAVAGGIPILDALQAPLNSNDIEEVSGIVNGTTNFILTRMTEEGADYGSTLRLAQESGFAETDPTDDVEGIDAANKLSILVALAFGKVLAVSDIPTTGISGIQSEDIAFAKDLGYKIKLLAAAKKRDGHVQASVQPTLVPTDALLASVNNEFNALLIKGNAVGDLIFYGRGAGGLPTASAVTGDMIEIANAIDKGAAFDTYVNQIQSTTLEYIAEGVNKYYVNLEVSDQVGVLGKVATIFADHHVSAESVLQRSARQRQTSIVFILHEVSRKNLDTALSKILGQGIVSRVKSVMRVV